MLPTNMQNFAPRYPIYSLVNVFNLKQWKIKTDAECRLCRENEAQLGLFHNC